MNIKDEFNEATERIREGLENPRKYNPNIPYQNPNYMLSYAYAHRGTIYLRSGHFYEAIRDFSSGISLLPSPNRLEEIYKERDEKFEYSVKSMLSGPRLHEDEEKWIEQIYVAIGCTLFDQRGLAYQKSGELEKAKSDYRVFLKMKPQWDKSNPLNNYQKALLYGWSGPSQEILNKRSQHNNVPCTKFHPNYSHAKWAQVTDYGRYPSVPKPNKYNFFGSGQDWGGGMTKKQYNEGCLINILCIMLLVFPLIIFL